MIQNVPWKEDTEEKNPIHKEILITAVSLVSLISNL